MAQHLGGVHQAKHLISRCRNDHVIEVPIEHLICPFCQMRSATWNERIEHVAGHFKKGERLYRDLRERRKDERDSYCESSCTNLGLGYI